MRESVSVHPDFKNEKSRVERFLMEEKGHIICSQSFIIPAMESVPLQRIQKHFQKVRYYMFTYLEGVPGGSDLENLVKMYKQKIVSS